MRAPEHDSPLPRFNARLPRALRVAGQLLADLLAALRRGRLLRGEIVGSFTAIFFALTEALDESRSFRAAAMIVAAVASVGSAACSASATLRLRHCKMSEQLCLGPLRAEDIVVGAIVYSLTWWVILMVVATGVLAAVRACVAPTLHVSGPAWTPILISGLVMLPLALVSIASVGLSFHFRTRWTERWRFELYTGVVLAGSLLLAMSALGISKIAWLDGAISVAVPGSILSDTLTILVIGAASLAVVAECRRVDPERFILEPPRLTRIERWGMR